MFSWFFRYYFSLQDIIHTWLWRKQKDSDIDIRVLMFHHISDKYISDMPNSCVCNIMNFSKIITSYINKNVRFMTPYEILNRKFDKGVMISFDDITNDVYYNAFPILVKYNIPFTIFVTVGFIDKSPYISKDNLLEMLKSSLCTLGAHSITHPNLRKSKNIEEEVNCSKKFLEELTKKPVDFFAYPFGKHSSVSCRVVNAVKKAGYKAAFGTINTPISEKSIGTRYYLPRIIENE